MLYYFSRHIPKRPGEEVNKFVNDSAYRLVRAQEENMVLKPWVLLVSLLLQNHHQNQTPVEGERRGIALDELAAQALWLRDLSREYGAFLHWPGEAQSNNIDIKVLHDKSNFFSRDHFYLLFLFCHPLFYFSDCLLCLVQTTQLHQK